MPYSVKVIRTADFIRLKSASNKIDINSARAALRVIGETCRAEGIDRVLIDTRDVTVPLTVPELFFLATSLAETGLPRSVWIAILPGSDRFDRAQFAALCAANRGWTIRAVRSFEEAINWFSESDPNQQPEEDESAASSPPVGESAPPGGKP